MTSPTGRANAGVARAKPLHPALNQSSAAPGRLRPVRLRPRRPHLHLLLRLGSSFLRSQQRPHARDPGTDGSSPASFAVNPVPYFTTTAGADRSQTGLNADRAMRQPNATPTAVPCATITTSCVNYLNPASFVTVYTATSYPLGTYGNTGKGSLQRPKLHQLGRGSPQELLPDPQRTRSAPSSTQSSSTSSTTPTSTTQPQPPTNANFRKNPWQAGRPTHRPACPQTDLLALTATKEAVTVAEIALVNCLICCTQSPVRQ